MKWHPWFHALIRRLYFSRVEVTGAEHVPAQGPVLVLCLHRNGAVDGFVYRGALPPITFMMKASLRRSFLGRMFFDGIEVMRGTGGTRDERNLRALDECVALLGAGGRLVVFPEGTSKLGPRHLPFKSGAARIALRHLESGRTLAVLPLGIHYECPWAFRSRVEVVIGPPLHLAPANGTTTRGARLQELKRRFAKALERVGVNVPDDEWQDLAQKFAYIATLGTRHSYFTALKAMEQRLPAEAVAAWKSLEQKARGRRLLRHQGVPLFPLSLPWGYAALALLLGGPVALGMLANLPPLAIAWWAGRRFPDDRNVIALWRILTGVPVFILWAVACCAGAIVWGPWWLPPAYLLITWIALHGWYRLKKLTVVAWNGLLHARLLPDALAVHRSVLAALANPPPRPPTAAGGHRPGTSDNPNPTSR